MRAFVRLFLLVTFIALLSAVQHSAQARTWTATDGRQLEAEFVSLEDGNISLRLANGQMAKFPLDRLIKEDNEAAQRFAKVGGDGGVLNSQPIYCRPLRPHRTWGSGTQSHLISTAS